MTYKDAAWIPVSDELSVDTATLSRAFAEMAEGAMYAFQQHELDRLLGPRFGPGRNEWQAITWPARRAKLRRSNLRYNLADMLGSHRPGRFVRHH